MLYSQSLISRRLTLRDDPTTIANHLTLHTCEIEEVRTRHLPELVVIGRVLSVSSHPDADKLVVCQLDCGHHGHFQICTGATNVSENILVPVALPGSHLPAIDLTIEPRKMRGEESNGMICAKEELGILEDQELHGIWILTDDFSDITDSDLGTPLATKYPRIENVIYDVENKTITHRPDLMGHAGIARELYAIYQQVKPDTIKSHNLNQFSSYAKESLDYLTHQETLGTRNIRRETDACRAYYAIDLTDIQVKPSTFHTRLQLLDLWLTPRNNRVDFSNMFMYQTGQPIHCFDSDTIDGAIIIRQATDGEHFVDLMDGEHVLTTHDIVIADDSKILALAGVIGGRSSAVTDQTKNITIELANFDPIIVRKTAIRHGLRTDASARFEKNISLLMTQSMIVALRDMMTYLGPDLGEIQRAGIGVYEILPLQMISVTRSIDELHRIVGDIPSDRMTQALTDLGFTIKDNEVIVPRRRSPRDITLSADVAEEVVRIVGYDTLTPRAISTTIGHQSPASQPTLQRQIEDTLTWQYHFDSVETYPRASDETYTLFGVDSAALSTLQNPLQPEQSHLSHSLLYNLIDIVAKNHKFYDTLRMYTVGSVRAGESRSYADTRWSIANLSDQVIESRQVGWLIYDAVSRDDLTANILTTKHIINSIAGQPVSYVATDAEQFHPRQQAQVLIDGTVVGFVGRLHPLILDARKLPSDTDLVYFTLDLAALEHLSSSWQATASDYHTLQDHILLRDLSFVVDRSESFEPLIAAIRQIDDITDVTVFDVYQGEHLPETKKSIALQLSIYHPDNNLTSDQINQILDRAIVAGQSTGAVLRKDFNW